MRTLLAMCVKDLRLLVRDRMGFFFTFFFPLIIAVFFGTVFSGSGGGGGDGETVKIKVLVVDADNTDASRRFVGQLKDASEFSVTTEPTLDEATKLLREGAGGYVAAVNIPKGYGEASERMFWGDPPLLEVYTDPSHKAEIGMFEGLLTKYAFMRMQDMFTNPTKFIPSTQDALAQLKNNAEMDPKAKSALESFLPNLEHFLGEMPAISDQATAGPDDKGAGGGGAGGLGSWQPVKIESRTVQAEGAKGPPNSYSVSFPQGVMWGVIGCSLAMALSLVTERTRGTLIRLRMAPLPRWRVLGGKALTCFVLMSGVAIVLLAIGMLPFFGVRPAAPVSLLVGILATSACFTGLMMLVAAVGKTEAAASGLGWAVMLIFSMIGGGMIPLYFLPKWLQGPSDISPVKWGILAIEGGVWRGFTLAQMLTPCAVLVVIGVVGFAAGTMVFGRKE